MDCHKALADGVQSDVESWTMLPDALFRKSEANMKIVVIKAMAQELS